MIPLDQSSYEEARRLANRVRRNRRRTLRLLVGAILLVMLWPLYFEYRARNTVVPQASWIQPVSAPRFAPRPASPDAKRKRVYPYSVIPGGVYSGSALAQALARDPALAAHYAGFNVAAARLVPAPRGLRAYTSYRIGDRIYWTAKRIALQENEALLTDGVHLVRARCGNRLSDAPGTPVGPEVELDSTEAEESAPQWRASDPENRGGERAPEYALSKVAPDVFPDAFVDNDGRLTIGASASAALLTENPATTDANESMSGYTVPKPAPANGQLPYNSWMAMGFGGGLPLPEKDKHEETGAMVVLPTFPTTGTSSSFQNSWQADLLPWPPVVPTAAASVRVSEPDQVGAAGAPVSNAAPQPPSSGAGSAGNSWDSFHLIVSGIAAAERGVVPDASGGGSGGGGGGGRPGGRGVVTPPGFPVIAGDIPATTAIPEPGAMALVALGLTLFAFRRVCP